MALQAKFVGAGSCVCVRDILTDLLGITIGLKRPGAGIFGRDI